MDLGLFNNLLDNIKKNDGVQNFMKDLSNFLEKSLTNNSKNDVRKDISILQQIQNEIKITTNYRDKMNIERINILNNYAEQTSEKGTMYYIYSKDSGKKCTYNLYNCEKGRSHDVIELEESKLPKEAGVDSVLRVKNGEYVLDKDATQDILNKMKEMANELLVKQNQELKEYRIEGHIYEFVEKSKDRIWLTNRTKNDGFCFEEIVFPEELLSKATKGNIFQYINGEYDIYAKGNSNEK